MSDMIFPIMYELMVIGSQKVEPDTLQTLVEKVLKGANAADLSVQKLGKKVLSFPIAKQTEAQYFVFNFAGDPSIINGINQKLRLEQEVILRYLLVKKEAAKVAKVPEVSKASETRTVVEKINKIKDNAIEKKKKTVKKVVAKSVKEKKKN